MCYGSGATLVFTFGLSIGPLILMKQLEWSQVCWYTCQSASHSVSCTAVFDTSHHILRITACCTGYTRYIMHKWDPYTASCTCHLWCYIIYFTKSQHTELLLLVVSQQQWVSFHLTQRKHLQHGDRKPETLCCCEVLVLTAAFWDSSWKVNFQLTELWYWETAENISD